MKVWILGGQGMVGSTLFDQLQEQGIEVIGSSKEEADISNLKQLKAKAQAYQPTHIVNCAAITNVDLAEKQPEKTFAINTTGATNVALAASEVGARLVHLSTDYVFDGKSSEAYREEDLCSPVNSYGKSKWEAEKGIANILPTACILRTSWLFGKKGKNFVSSLLKLFQEKEELEVALDHYAKPTYSEDLAQAISALLNFEGIIHFANATPLSRVEVATSLLEAVIKKGMPIKCHKIIEVLPDRFPSLAPRPFKTLLDTTRYEHYTSQVPRSWYEVIEEYLDEI